jgi:hypothetical protein
VSSREKYCAQVTCSIVNEKGVFQSTESRSWKGIIQEEEQRKNKRRWIYGDIAQPNEQNLKERLIPEIAHKLDQPHRISAAKADA